MNEAYDHGAERAVICVLARASRSNPGDARILHDRYRLDPSDFYLPLHQAVYRAVSGLLERNLPVDRVGMAGVATGLPEAQWVGLLTGDGSLPFLAGDGLRAGFEGYVTTVRDLAMRRRAVAELQDTLGRLRAGVDVHELLSDHARRLARMSSRQEHLKTVAEATGELLGELDLIQSGKKTPCIPTDIIQWDRVLGGLEPGTATFIGAQAGVGKSALLATILRNLATRGVKCGVFSLEDLRTWLPRRYVSDSASVPLFVLTKKPLGQQQRKRVNEAAKAVSDYGQNIIVDDRSMLTVAQIEHTARDMILNRGCQMLVIDHLGKIDYQAKDFHRHDLAIGDALGRFIGLAKTYNVPLLIAAHFKNTGEGSKFKRPELNDFAQAMFIGRDARLAVGMYIGNDENGKPSADSVDITVLKQTSGMSDVDFRLQREAQSGLFANSSKYDNSLVIEDYEEQERSMLKDSIWGS